jgi:glycosyltransferase involved in cell wall biosynthesis
VRWPAFEWVAARLSRDRFDLSFLLLGDRPPPLKPHLEALGVEAHHIHCIPRRGVFRAAGEVERYCRTRAIEVVHTHFMDACLAGLVGARRAGVKIRIHTRHHAGPYPLSHRPPWGALYDRWNNRLSTTIIAPSDQARRALVDHDGAPERKVVLIPHGFDLGVFRDVPASDVQCIRQKYGLDGRGPIVGVVARYERIKGVEPIVVAFESLLKTYPEACLVLANARGRRAGAVRALLEQLPAGSFREIPFEEDMPALFKTFDVFVHAPLDPRLEAFGQVYVEAMAAGVPCIAVPAGIACEFMVDGENAVVVEPGRPDVIRDGVARGLADASLRNRVTSNALSIVEQRFGIDRMVRSLEDLYTQLLP